VLGQDDRAKRYRLGAAFLKWWKVWPVSTALAEVDTPENLRADSPLYFLWAACRFSDAIGLKKLSERLRTPICYPKIFCFSIAFANCLRYKP
jgi:hypothetical protein